ncbi:MAG: signal peptidase II [Treponemataceae bacterium]
MKIKRFRYVFITLITLGANFSLDRITKLLAQKYLEGEKPVSLLGNSIVFVFVENSGAFLGLGAVWPDIVKYLVLLIIPIGVCAYGIYHSAFKETNIRRLVLMTCIIGGGLSNLIDRVFNDFKVVDFMNFGIGALRTGVLNVADLSVTFGALILLATEFLSGKAEHSQGWKS